MRKQLSRHVVNASEALNIPSFHEALDKAHSWTIFFLEGVCVIDVVDMCFPSFCLCSYFYYYPVQLQRIIRIAIFFAECRNRLLLILLSLFKTET